MYEACGSEQKEILVQEAFGEETAPEVQLGEFREEQMAELAQRLQKTCVETIEEFGRKVRRM